MTRRGRGRAFSTVLISVCLGLFAAAQSPADAASATAGSTAAKVSTATAQPAQPSATRATPAKATAQNPDYKPAGCYDATPSKGTASCFALVRTSDGRMLAATSGPPSTALTPADLQAAYGLPATGGQGRTVAVVDADGYSTAEADLAIFRAQYGLSACTTANGCFRKVDQRGGTDYPADDTGWSTETALDLDAVSSACPDCHILLVEADSAQIPDLSAAVETAVSLGAQYVSNSYGASDPAVAGQVSDADYNHPGVVVTASTGDVGNAIEWPSSDPDVVAVGGTSLTAAPGTARGWTETAWSNGGSGCSAFEPRPVYQSALATGCANRATADVSADADPNSGLAEYDALNGGWVQVGGTSLASPLIASMYALAGTPAAGTYPVTYPYIHGGSGLNDIAAGSDGTCGDVLCTAGPGWDGPTGLGSPDGVSALTLGPQGTVTGRLTDRASGAALAGVSVVLTDAADHLTFRALTDSAGDYQLSVSAGTYALTASEFGYGTDAATLTVTAGQSTTTNLSLTKTPVRTVTGKVTDSGHGWPLYAKITVAGDPNAPVYTDPFTGTYSVSLPEQADYAVAVTPDYPGYATSDTTVVLGSSNLQRNVSLSPDVTGCTAPGYAYPAQADFDGWTTAAEYGWTVTENGSTVQGWQFDDPGAQGNLTGGTGNFATADPNDDSGLSEDTDLTSPTFSLAGLHNADLRFNADSAFATGSEADAAVSTDGGRTWTSVYQAANAVDGPVDIPLTGALGHRDVQVRFHFAGQGQSLFQVSNVSVGQCQALGGGLIEGTVTDADTRQPLEGAVVTDASAPVTDMLAQAVSAANPQDPKLPAGFYWLYSPKTGGNTLVTTMPRYAAARAAVTASASVHSYDAVLTAGRLKVTPSTVSLKTALGSKASQDVTLTNTGTAPLKVTLQGQNLGTAGSTAASSATGAWQALPAYPEPVIDNVVGSYEGDTYSIGGTQAAFSFVPPYEELVKQNYVYTPGSDSWTQIADLPQYRTAATGAFVDGTLYVVGGLDYATTGSTAIYEPTTYAYHPGSDSWTQVANLPQALAYANAAVYDGRLYVIGGETASGSTDSVYRYDPATNTWTQIANYPVPMDAGGCGGIVGGIVCAGGRDIQNQQATVSAATYLYHAGSNTWTRGADMPIADELGSYSSSGGELQVAGGIAVGLAGQAEGPSQNAEQYDPVGDVWTALPAAPAGVYGAGRSTGCGLNEVGGSVEGLAGGGTAGEALAGFDQCGGDDAAWLSQSTNTLELAPGASARVQVTADGSVLSAPGSYSAELDVFTDSPYPTAPVPVTVKAVAPASWAQVSGTVTDAASGDPLPGATIAVSHAGRGLITVTTDSLGRYDVWVAPSALTLTAGDTGYTGQSKAVTTRPGADAKADFALTTG